MTEVIVALDTPSVDDALRLVDRLPNLVWAKIGPMLQLQDGTALVRELESRGIRVFLDLKWHDIPNSVAGAVRAAAGLGVALATVHTLGGEAMLEAAVEASGSMRLAAVSVLTSHTVESYRKALGLGRETDLVDEVIRLARMAVGAGVGAIVTSPLEVARVREAAGPQTWLIVPGIRPPGAPADDQQRTTDPASAVRGGATHLVVGRPILMSNDPGAVYQEICEAVA